MNEFLSQGMSSSGQKVFIRCDFHLAINDIRCHLCLFPLGDVEGLWN